jgi:signal transduction histidine kinase
MDPNGTSMKRTSGTPSPGRTSTIRWRWYHFYFVLALFDLIVIIASLTLYHRTLADYSVALTELSRLDAAHTWVSHLRNAIVQLNAPGNDVFATRRVSQERDRFEHTRQGYSVLVKRADEFDVDLTNFERKMADMILQEERIFDIFEGLESQNLDPAREQENINEATSFMASMDRYQAEALESMDMVAEDLHRLQHALLSRYGGKLERSAAFEKYFLGIVALILVGMFWYGRKLQRTHEAMINQQQRAIEERHARLAAVGEVCSAVSHGIRNPLAAITSSAQLALEYGTLDDSTRLRIEDVLHESRRLNLRVSRLLSFSNPQVGSFERCDLQHIVEQVLEEIQPKLADCKVEASIEFPEQPLIVQGDPEWLAQAVIELVSNSMDHSPEGGQLWISGSHDPDWSGWVRLDVVDSGPGIPETVLPHVFDLFFTSKAEGNGIGLASVKRVVEMHNGTVTAGNGASGGAHICIRLPQDR